MASNGLSKREKERDRVVAFAFDFVCVKVLFKIFLLYFTSFSVSHLP